MATAKHRAIDRIRRDIALRRKHEELGARPGGAPRLAEDDLDAP